MKTMALLIAVLLLAGCAIQTGARWMVRVDEPYQGRLVGNAGEFEIGIVRCTVTTDSGEEKIEIVGPKGLLAAPPYQRGSTFHVKPFPVDEIVPMEKLAVQK